MSSHLHRWRGKCVLTTEWAWLEKELYQGEIGSRDDGWASREVFGFYMRGKTVKIFFFFFRMRVASQKS